MKMWWLYDRDDQLYQSLTPFALIHRSRSHRRSDRWVLYYISSCSQNTRFDQSGSLRCKMHMRPRLFECPAGMTPSTINRQRDMSIKSCQIAAVRIFRFGDKLRQLGISSFSADARFYCKRRGSDRELKELELSLHKCIIAIEKLPPAPLKSL